MPYDRIVIIGKPGAGKTTLARQLAKLLDSQHVELDAIHWLPNWVEMDKAQMQERVSEALPAAGRWVVDGNYDKVREISWGRAETLIWLDFPLWLTLWRLLCRTLGRYFLRRELWNGNRENIWSHFTLDRYQNLFLYAYDSHYRHKVNFPRAFQEPAYSHLKVLRFHHPKELEEWLESLNLAMSDATPVQP